MPSLFSPPQIEANPISITRMEIPSVLAHREKKGGRRGGKRSRNGSVSRGGGVPTTGLTFKPMELPNRATHSLGILKTASRLNYLITSPRRTTDTSGKIKNLVQRGNKTMVEHTRGHRGCQWELPNTMP